MAYSFTLTIPKNTAKSIPKEYALMVLPLTIDEVYITFPYGCMGLVGCQFYFQSRQLYPYTPNEWFIGNDQVIPLRPKTDIHQQPYELVFKAYNLDDSYKHTLYVVINVTFRGSFWDNVNRFLGSTALGVALPGRK